MAVLFGDRCPDGWVRTSCIQYLIDADPNGFTVDKDTIPPYPDSSPGVGWVQFYNPSSNQWRYDPVKIPYTQEEALLEIASAIRQLADTLKEK